MADDRVIHNAIRLPGKKDGKRFTKGTVIKDPDELAKLAAEKDSGIELQALLDRGAISGTWKGTKAVKDEAPKGK